MRPCTTTRRLRRSSKLIDAAVDPTSGFSTFEATLFFGLKGKQNRKTAILWVASKKTLPFRADGKCAQDGTGLTQYCIGQIFLETGRAAEAAAKFAQILSGRLGAGRGAAAPTWGSAKNQ